MDRKGMKANARKAYKRHYWMIVVICLFASVFGVAYSSSTWSVNASSPSATVQEDGTACGRHHHHAIIQHTDGLTRDVLEQLWADKAGQIGFTRCEYLDVDHGSVESLVRYISKNKRCARSWRQSRGLEKPKTPPPNDSKWSRKKLDEASTLYIDDVAYWERKYPGYTLNRVETRVSNAGWRHTTVIMRRAECWHGTPGRKVTPRMNR